MRCLKGVRDAIVSTLFLHPVIRLCGHVGVLPVAVLRRLYLCQSFTFKVRNVFGHDFFLYRFVPGDEIGQMLYWRGIGGWEPETIRFLRHFLQARQHQTPVIVDVGSNTGHFALAALSCHAGVHVVVAEPVPMIFDRLKANIEQNAYGGRVYLFQGALGASDTESVTLHLPEGHGVLPTSASLNPAGLNNMPGSILNVPMQRLDHVLPLGWIPDLIKIDVEGFEAHVIKGCLGLLEDGHRPAFILERLQAADALDWAGRLSGFGYRFAHLTPSGPVARDPCDETILPCDHYCRNWLATTIPDRS